MSKIASQFIHVFSVLPPKKRIAIIVTIIATIGSLAGIVFWANRPDYRLLYSGLSPEDAGAVLNILKQKKLPYKIESAGNSILVPSDSIYELRMEIASEGLPQGGGIGYEIFDNQKIGMTEFVQRINFQRALQGELMRTINQITEVKSSRVHLTIPEKTLFVDEQQQPRASVVLYMQPGKTLKTSQIAGIVHLVASSVEGLDPESVTIIDQHGKILAGGEKDSPLDRISTTQQQIKLDTEQNLERRIETMMSKIVGEGKVSARVSVAMNFRQVERTEETYDPDSAAVRSEQVTKEKSSGKQPVATGVPGVVSNTPDLQSAASTSAKSSSFTKSDETINYEISRVTQRVIEPVGTIERLTVAVLVDGIYKTAKNENGKNIQKYIPRTDDEIAKYKALIKKIVGFDEKRGDSVEVVNARFQNLGIEDVSENALESIFQKPFWSSLMRYGFGALLFVVFFFAALRPLIKWLTSTSEEIQKISASSAGTEAVGSGGSAYSLNAAPEDMGDRERLQTLAKKNPERFAQALNSWIK